MGSARDVVLQLVTFVCLLRSTIAVLPFYSMHVAGCNGQSISSTNYAGEVTFTSRFVHDDFYYTKKCDVMVTPKSLTNASQVMFYFTEFNVGEQCKDNNLTIYDGRDSKHIKGLEGSLCEHNTSLENTMLVFTSTETEIRLIYRWTDRGSYSTGSFKMVFVSFYGGPCKPDSDDFPCSTDRCISSEIACRDDLNYCGNGEESRCSMFGTMQHILKSLMNVARNLFLLVAIVIVMSLIKRVVYNRLKEKHGSVSNFPLIRRILGHNSYADRGGHHRRSVAVQNNNIPVVERVPLNYYGVHVPAFDDAITGPPSYEEVTRNDNAPTACLSPNSDPASELPVGSSSSTPPPTYEDVIANSGGSVK